MPPRGVVLVQELKEEQGWKQSHLSAVELRGVASPRGAAGPAAPCLGLVLKARNFPSSASGRPFTASTAAAAPSPLTGSSRLSRSALGSRREMWARSEE